jgi:hypothetical protein
MLAMQRPHCGPIPSRPLVLTLVSPDSTLGLEIASLCPLIIGLSVGQRPCPRCLASDSGEQEAIGSTMHCACFSSSSSTSRRSSFAPFVHSTHRHIVQTLNKRPRRQRQTVRPPLRKRQEPSPQIGPNERFSRGPIAHQVQYRPHVPSSFPLFPCPRRCWCGR